MKKKQRNILTSVIIGFGVAVTAVLLWQVLAPQLPFERMERVMRAQMGDADDVMMGASGMMNGKSGKAGGAFSQETDGLPDVVPTQVVELADGDTYEMVAEVVKQEVGNRVVRRLAYNRMIPGPVIKVPRGGKITLKFTNKLDIPTTLHSHGLRGEDAFDGLPTTMGGKQKPMQPGETFVYELTFPDAGVFWYHPHLREDYTQEMGLYGNYWVDAPDYWAPADREAFLIVDDFAENEPFYKEVTTHTMMGRYGNLLMINNDTDYRLEARTGERVRFFVTNTANTRVFDIALKDARGNTVPLTVVGGDIGRVEKEYVAKHTVLAPAERVIFEAAFAQPGTYTIEHRGTAFGKVVVTGAPQAVAPRPLRTNAADYAPLRTQFDALLARTPDKRLRLAIGMKGMGEMRRGMRHRNGMGRMMGGTQADLDAEERRMGGTPQRQSGDGIEWGDSMAMMNARSNSAMMEWMLIDEDSGKVNMAIDDWTFTTGQFVKVRIFNDPRSMHPMQHPIHFHGQRFAVIASDWGSTDGTLQPRQNLQWKDTALIRAGETVDIIVEMTNPGDWMAHCHIAEHLHAGMMLNFSVRDAQDTKR